MLQRYAFFRVYQISKGKKDDSGGCSPQFWGLNEKNVPINPRVSIFLTTFEHKFEKS